MNKLVKLSILLTAYSLLLTAFPAVAASSLDLGDAGVGARPMGMGKAFIGLGDDANAVFLNPAGLAKSDKIQATSMSANLMQTVEYKMAAGSLPTAYGTIGIGYISLSSTAGYATTDKTSITGAAPIDYGASQLVVSYGREINGVSTGANVKMISNNFNGYSGSGSGYGVDLAALVNLDKNFRVGANLQNALSSISWKNSSTDTLPMVLKIGAADTFANGKVTLAADVDCSFSNKPLVIHGGVEARPTSFATLRAGIDQYASSSNNVATNITAGVGLNFKGVSFDYAYHDDQEIRENATHYFSISIAMDSLNQQSAKPASSNVPVVSAALEKQRELGIITEKQTTDAIMKYYENGDSLKSDNNVKSSNSVKAASTDILSFYR